VVGDELDAAIQNARAARSSPSTGQYAGSAPLVNPAAGRRHFNSPETAAMTQEKLAFALADDPRGYGNPDSGWRRVTQTNRVLADPLPGTPPEIAVFAVR
jgi:hypothetical protein